MLELNVNNVFTVVVLVILKSKLLRQTTLKTIVSLTQLITQTRTFSREKPTSRF